MVGLYVGLENWFLKMVDANFLASLVSGCTSKMHLFGVSCRSKKKSARGRFDYKLLDVRVIA